MPEKVSAGTVNTVLGLVSAERLGKTLVHEHVLFGYPGWYGDASIAPFDRATARSAIVDALEQVRALGVKTIVDATPNDCGRDPEFLADVAAASGINIVCSTGYYYEGEGASAYFRFRHAFGDVEAEIYELLVKEIAEGIGGTGVRAGVIKLASSKGAITDYERPFFKAAARAQRDTGVPIITHTQEGTMGPEQAELLIAEGADPRRVMIGHMGDNTDVEYHLRALAQGVYVAFDRMGIQGFGWPQDAERYACLVELIGAGYARRITLSHDYIFHLLGRPVVLPEAMLPCFADWRPSHVFEDVIPALRKRGITDEQVETIVVDNPRRLFEGE